MLSSRGLIATCLVTFSALNAAGRAGESQPGEPHREVNALYAELLAKGLSVKGGKRLELAVPILTEEMDAKAQRAALAKLAGVDYPLDELLRPSVVAPHVYKFRTLPAPDAERAAHAVDLWFIAHGDVSKVSSATLQNLFSSKRSETRVHTLDEGELKSRGLSVANRADREEAYVYTIRPIIDRVQVEGTSHTIFTRKPKSLLLASRLDPAFADDSKYANRWRHLNLDDGKPKLGPAQPYEGAALYVRLTRLHEPAGAALVEFHQVFLEPREWFGGTNQLRSKLPIVIQNEVRAFRRELSRLTP